MKELPEALASVLGGVIADMRAEGRKEIERLSSEARATIAELRAEIADLKADLRARMADVKNGTPGPMGPAGRDGIDGKDGAPGRDGENGRNGIDGNAGERGLQGEPGPAGRDGVDGPQGPHGERGEKGEPGRGGTDGKDGVGLAGAVIDNERRLVLTLTDGTTRQLGIVVGSDGAKGDPGSNGKDGLGFDDMSLEWRDERAAVLKFDRDGREKCFTLAIPALIDRGVYRAGEKYSKGDCVTFQGSLWIAQTETEAKPGDDDTFRLAVKRGRDGKPGQDGSPGPQGPKGDPWFDGGECEQ